MSSGGVLNYTFIPIITAKWCEKLNSDSEFDKNSWTDVVFMAFQITNTDLVLVELSHAEVPLLLRHLCSSIC